MTCRSIRGFVLIPALAALTVSGQSFSGRIVGLVTDSSAVPIPRAAMTVMYE